MSVNEKDEGIVVKTDMGSYPPAFAEGLKEACRRWGEFESRGYVDLKTNMVTIEFTAVKIWPKYVHFKNSWGVPLAFQCDDYPSLYEVIDIFCNVLTDYSYTVSDSLERDGRSAYLVGWGHRMVLSFEEMKAIVQKIKDLRDEKSNKDSLAANNSAPRRVGKSEQLSKVARDTQPLEYTRGEYMHQLKCVEDLKRRKRELRQSRHEWKQMYLGVAREIKDRPYLVNPSYKYVEELIDAFEEQEAKDREIAAGVLK